MASGPNAFVLYDSDCGLCSQFMRIVKRLDLRDRIVPVNLNSSLAVELVDNRLTKDELMSSFHLVVAGDEPEKTRVFSAGNGLIHLLRYMPGGVVVFPVVRRFGPTRAFVRWVYRQAAKLRQKSAACAVREN